MCDSRHPRRRLDRAGSRGWHLSARRLLYPWGCLVAVPIRDGITKLVAAAYLLFLGVQAIRESLRAQTVVQSTSDEVSVRPWRAFGLGFLTNGLNPKATLFFLALFTVVIDPDTPLILQLGYGLYLGIATFAWFAALSLLLGRPAVRAFVLRAGVWFERGMGLVLILLAAQIVRSI